MYRRFAPLRSSCLKKESDKVASWQAGKWNEKRRIDTSDIKEKQRKKMFSRAKRWMTPLNYEAAQLILRVLLIRVTCVLDFIWLFQANFG